MLEKTIKGSRSKLCVRESAVLELSLLLTDILLLIDSLLSQEIVLIIEKRVVLLL